MVTKEYKKMKPKITIAIPAYNSAKTIRHSIESAIEQFYPRKEVLVVDDGSTDDTVRIAEEYPHVRVVQNKENLGIGVNLANCMEQAYGKYIVFLCSDDVFTDKRVVGDIVRIFDLNPKIGVIDRNYYQFMDGKPGAVMTVREKNIFISSCNPSGMAFRTMKVIGSNTIFIEMPMIVRQYLNTFEWTKMEYDTVAVRLHPSGNTGCKASYYKDSPIRVWTNFLGSDFKYHLGLIQLKNRAPKLVWNEICLTVQINKKNLYDPFFWFCALTALIVPSFILRWLSDFYRDNISRHNCRIIRREDV